MTCICTNCSKEFEIVLHKSVLIEGVEYIYRGTGLNVAYLGEHDEEFPFCPYCDYLQEDPVNEAL